jgi:uncharacterized membrane protein
MKTNNFMSTKKLVLGAVLSAIVIVLQFMGAFIRFGTFSISLVLVPIVIGAAMCDYRIGAWLGFLFGVIVLASGDAAAFLAINIPGTVITVLLKGTACGLIAGLVYKALEKFNRYAAVVAAAIACPVVNTGIFLLGCSVFFMDTVKSWAAGGNVFVYMILFLVGGNFLVELAVNMVLSPMIVRILNIKQKGISK